MSGFCLVYHYVELLYRTLQVPGKSMTLIALSGMGALSSRV